MCRTNVVQTLPHAHKHHCTVTEINNPLLCSKAIQMLSNQTLLYSLPEGTSQQQASPATGPLGNLTCVLLSDLFLFATKHLQLQSACFTATLSVTRGQSCQVLPPLNWFLGDIMISALKPNKISLWVLAASNTLWKAFLSSTTGLP